MKVGLDEHGKALFSLKRWSVLYRLYLLGNEAQPATESRHLITLRSRSRSQGSLHRSRSRGSLRRSRSRG